MRNPFDLTGPEFLVFYIFVSAVTIATVVWFRRIAESGPVPQLDLADPYAVAYLRGGISEAAKVATISLIDRGYLTNAGSRVVPQKKDSSVLTHEIERCVLQWFSTTREFSSLDDRSLFEQIDYDYKRRMVNLGAYPDEDAETQRAIRITVGAAVLGGIAIIKAAIGLSRGRPITFLVILAFASIVVLFAVGKPRRTTVGDELLSSIKTLFGDLKSRRTQIKPGGSTKEVAWLAAAFGIGLLPATSFPFVKQLRPQAASGHGDGGCSSSCSSSSCGSSCGGGGCGGGCGGCGS